MRNRPKIRRYFAYVCYGIAFFWGLIALLGLARGLALSHPVAFLTCATFAAFFTWGGWYNWLRSS